METIDEVVVAIVVDEGADEVVVLLGGALPVVADDSPGSLAAVM